MPRPLLRPGPGNWPYMAQCLGHRRPTVVDSPTCTGDARFQSHHSLLRVPTGLFGSRCSLPSCPRLSLLLPDNASNASRDLPGNRCRRYRQTPILRTSQPLSPHRAPSTASRRLRRRPSAPERTGPTERSSSIGRTRGSGSRRRATSGGT